MSDGRRSGRVAWGEVLSEVVVVDEARRRATVPSAWARDFLRLTPEEFDQLTAAGLPSVTVDGDRRYDFRDLYNVGLYTGRGESRAEQALKVMMRFAARPVEELFAPRRWSVRIRGDCAGCGSRGVPAGTWHVSQPDLASTGGRTISWQVRTRDGAAGGAEIPADLLVEGVVETVGVRRRIVSPRILAEVERFSALGLRWHLLSEDQWTDLDRLHRAGVTDCVMASLHLADRLNRLGVEAETRCGWMTGIVNVSHAWLEVRDDDGLTKTIDLILPLLAEMLTPNSEAYRQMAPGSLTNRVIRADCAADQPLVTHRHGTAAVEADLLTEVRPVLDDRDQT